MTTLIQSGSMDEAFDGATTRWDAARAAKIRLLEVRGALPLAPPLPARAAEADEAGSGRTFTTCLLSRLDNTAEDAMFGLMATGGNALRLAPGTGVLE